MQTSKFIILFIFLVHVLSIIVGIGCKKKDSGNNFVYPSSYSSSQSYSGELSVVIDNLTYHELTTVSFTVGNDMNGSYFQHSDGLTGSFNGSKNDNEYHISGYFNDYLRGDFSGSIDIIDDTNIDIYIEGFNNDTNFESYGSLSKISFINVEGNYFAHEKVTLTIEVGGESETDTIEGSDYIYLEQQGNKVSYVVPGTQVNRVGDIVSNLLTFSGIFVIPGGGIVITKNEFYADVSISNQYDYTFVGLGIAEGVYQGMPVRIIGNTNGTLKRQFDVAVGILRGGSWWYNPQSSWIIPPELIEIQDQVVSQYPIQVVSKCFASGNQISNVCKWLDYFVDKLETPEINVILVGHSLGGNAIRIGDFGDYNLYSRVFIDPINPDEINLLKWDETANQRDLIFPVVHLEGYYLNYLASTTDILNGENPYGLLGHHITQAVEYIEENTNHMTIVDRIVERQYILNEVTNCLLKSDKNKHKNKFNHLKPSFICDNMKIITLFNYPCE